MDIQLTWSNLWTTALSRRCHIEETLETLFFDAGLEWNAPWFHLTAEKNPNFEGYWSQENTTD